MSGNDYVKYITEQLITYLNKTPEEKRQTKIQNKKKAKVNFTNQWLGIFPMAIRLLVKKE